MTLKSYFSGTVEAAMELARKELGEDALLVNARPSTPETRYLGAYEVVFGLVPRAGATFEPAAIQPASDLISTRPLAMAARADAGASAVPQSRSTSAPGPQLSSIPKPKPPAEATAPASRAPLKTPAAIARPEAAAGPFTQNLTRLRLEIAHLSNSARPQLASPARPAPTTRSAAREPAPVSPSTARLRDAQASASNARELSQASSMANTHQRFQPSFFGPTFAEPVVERQENGDFRQEFGGHAGSSSTGLASNNSLSEASAATDPTLGHPGSGQAIVALVGPPGAGKTTALIKLAAKYGLAQRKSVQILTADVHRIAAADQLRSLAAILGISCEVAQTPHMLARLLDQHRDKELILIDTPGFGGTDFEQEEARELAEALIPVSMSEDNTAQSAGTAIDVHLVLPATMSASEMDRTVTRYAAFQPSKLLFTRLDEAENLSTIQRIAISRRLPISFLSNGQQMPDDLLEADAEWIQQHSVPASQPRQNTALNRIAHSDDPTSTNSRYQRQQQAWTRADPQPKALPAEVPPARRAMAAGAGR